MSIITRTAPPPLLTAGLLAAPLWILLAAGQALTRTGFDLTRHPISMLSLGDLGWIQVAAFLVAGALTLCGAAGLHQALHRARAGGA